MSFQLRNYLYLDEEAVDDFLAQLEGAPTVGTYSEKEVTPPEASSQDAASATEVHRIRQDTPLVKVTHLLDLLDQGQHIKSLDDDSPNLYDSIRVRSIVEISGLARLPKWEELKRGVASASSWVQILEEAGQNLLADESARLAMDAFTKLSAMEDSQEAVIILTPSQGQNFQVVTRLKTKYLRRAKEEFEVELTILGKVQKRLVKGQEIDITGLWPKIESFQPRSPKQRHQGGRITSRAQSSDNPFEEALREVVKYPAIELLPIAVYQ